MFYDSLDGSFSVLVAASGFWWWTWWGQCSGRGEGGVKRKNGPDNRERERQSDALELEFDRYSQTWHHRLARPGGTSGTLPVTNNNHESLMSSAHPSLRVGSVRSEVTGRGTFKPRGMFVNNSRNWFQTLLLLCWTNAEKWSVTPDTAQPLLPLLLDRLSDGCFVLMSNSDDQRCKMYLTSCVFSNHPPQCHWGGSIKLVSGWNYYKISLLSLGCFENVAPEAKVIKC